MELKKSPYMEHNFITLPVLNFDPVLQTFTDRDVRIVSLLTFEEMSYLKESGELVKSIKNKYDPIGRMSYGFYDLLAIEVCLRSAQSDLSRRKELRLRQWIIGAFAMRLETQNRLSGLFNFSAFAGFSSKPNINTNLGNVSYSRIYDFCILTVRSFRVLCARLLKTQVGCGIRHQDRGKRRLSLVSSRVIPCRKRT